MIKLMSAVWRFKKQFLFFVLAAGVIGLAVYLVYLGAKSAGSCFDAKKNQNEEGIDCGGPCELACFFSVKPLNILWTRPFEVKSGSYDVAAFVQNPNTLLAASSLVYKFKIYDANNILIAVKESQTFVNSGENFVIFEPNVVVGQRVPQRAVIEFENAVWKRVEKAAPFLKADKKEFVNVPFPRLSAEIQNKSIFDVSDIYAAAVLFDENGNAKAVSQIKIDNIKAESAKTVSFTWPAAFENPPASTEIFLRTRIAP